LLSLQHAFRRFTIVLAVSLKETRAFRSVSFIAIVAVIATSIERRSNRAGCLGRFELKGGEITQNETFTPQG
jgi:hypothetical protein